MEVRYKDFMGIFAIGYGMGLLSSPYNGGENETVPTEELTLDDFADMVEFLHGVFESEEGSPDKAELDKTLENLENCMKDLQQKIKEAQAEKATTTDEDEKLDNVPEVTAQVVDEIDIAIVEAIKELNELAKKKYKEGAEEK